MRDSKPSAPRPFSQRLARMLVFGRRPGWTLVRIAVLVAGVVVVFTVVLMPIRIEGVSMFPTCKDGEIHCVHRRAYFRREPRRFDVVAVRAVKDGPILLKRVVGLPGEEVALRGGVVHINGRPLEEPHVRGKSKWEEHAVRLSGSQYFLMGDNRTMERALHSHGYAERWMIVGRLWF